MLKSLFAILLGVMMAGGASAQNLVRNASFEEGSSTPASWARDSLPPGANVPVSIEIDKSTAKVGSASLKFDKSENRFFPVAMMVQGIGAPVSGKRLKVGMWVKAANVRKATMGVIFVGGNEKSWGAFVGEQGANDKPANHDWTYYGAVLEAPSGTTNIVLTLEMYGPGTAWIDGVSAEWVAGDTPLLSATKNAPGGAESEVDPMADVKDVPCEDLKAGGDAMKRYFLIGGKKDAPLPFKLLIVMPGGDGGADFNPFMRRVWKNALPEGYIVAQIVAPKWAEEQAQQLVWPTKKQKWTGMKFSTEELVEAVIADVKSKYKVDDSKVFTLSWSSGGPAAYATSLTSTKVKGSFIAMSVYKPDQLPPLFMAKGHSYYLLHSPEDFIPISMPRLALKELGEKGAKITLETYPGGHGWRSDPFGNIRKGVEWLEKNAGG